MTTHHTPSVTEYPALAGYASLRESAESLLFRLDEHLGGFRSPALALPPDIAAALDGLRQSVEQLHAHDNPPRVALDQQR